APDLLQRLPRLAEGGARALDGRPCGGDAPLERPATEVVPETCESRAFGLECRELRGNLRVQALGGAHLAFGALAARELRAIVLREVSAALAILLLARQIGDETRDELATRLPQAPQLIEHQCRVGGLGGAEAPLEYREHVLHALGGRLLLLDQVLEPEDLLLQVAIGFLELGAIAKQRQHPM